MSVDFRGETRSRDNRITKGVVLDVSLVESNLVMRTLSVDPPKDWLVVFPAIEAKHQELHPWRRGYLRKPL